MQQQCLFVDLTIVYRWTVCAEEMVTQSNMKPRLKIPSLYFLEKDPFVDFEKEKPTKG